MTQPDQPTAGSVSLDKAGPAGAPGPPDAPRALEPSGAEPVPAVPLADDGQPTGDGVPGAPAAARPQPRGRLAVLAAVVLVTALLGAIVAVLAVRVAHAREVASYYRPSSAPLSTARDASRALFSYDYRHLDKDFAAGAAYATGTFQKEYASTTAKVVRDVATRYKAVVQADPVEAGITQADPGRVVALVFINQVTTSNRVEGQKLDRSRVRMVLTKQGNRWLVSEVKAL